MNIEFIETLLNTAVEAGTPLLLATLGEIYAERSGVLNLGVEGMMIIGSITAFSIALITSNPWLGIILAAIAGGILALIHAFASITLRANQIVSGLAITMFGLGLSGLLGKNYVGLPLPSHIRPVPIPFLSNIPVLGPFLFKHDLLVYISLILVPILWIILFKTKVGINIRSVGENPAAADALGVNVYRIRYFCVIFGGVLAGLAGAYL